MILHTELKERSARVKFAVRTGEFTPYPNIILRAGVAFPALKKQKSKGIFMKVLNFGSLNLDYVYQVESILIPGETQASKDRKTFCGGKGLNQSIALAKAGIGGIHAGMIGEEGEILLKTCQEGGVNSRYIRKTTEKSGHTIIQVDKDGQNCILLYGGANQSITREYVDEVLSHFEKGDILLLQNEINLLDYIINQAYEKGMMIILNPSPYNETLDSCDFKKISMLLLNEVEGAQMTGEKDEKKILVRSGSCTRICKWY